MNLASETLGVFQDPPAVPQGYAAAIEASIKKHSESFVRDDRDLEMSVCAMIAVVHAIEGGGRVSEGWGAADVLATIEGLVVGRQLLAGEPGPQN